MTRSRDSATHNNPQNVNESYDLPALATMSITQSIVTSDVSQSAYVLSAQRRSMGSDCTNHDCLRAHSVCILR